MKDINVMSERLIATAIEATIIVVESRLHGDPIPSLRSHYRCIVEERERLYAHYQHVERRALEHMLSEQGVRALLHEFRADTRQRQDSLRITFLDVLFSAAEPRPTHARPADLTAGYLPSLGTSPAMHAASA